MQNGKNTHFYTISYRQWNKNTNTSTAASKHFEINVIISVYSKKVLIWIKFLVVVFFFQLKNQYMVKLKEYVQVSNLQAHRCCIELIPIDFVWKHCLCSSDFGYREAEGDPTKAWHQKTQGETEQIWEKPFSNLIKPTEYACFSSCQFFILSFSYMFCLMQATANTVCALLFFQSMHPELIFSLNNYYGHKYIAEGHQRRSVVSRRTQDANSVGKIVMK